MNRDQLLDRVRKLLALADQGRNNSVAEAASAAALAQRLLLENQLSVADVETINPLGTAADPIVEIEGDRADEGRLPLWLACLMHGIATANDCTTIRWRGGTGYNRITVIGPKSTVDGIVYLYQYLAKEIERLRQARGTARGPLGVARPRGRSWHASFRIGAVNEVCARLKTARRDQTVELGSKCTALVLRSKVDVERFKEEHHPNTTKGRRSQARSSDGYHDGREAARSINLGGGKGLPSPAKQLGR